MWNAQQAKTRNWTMVYAKNEVDTDSDTETDTKILAHRTSLQLSVTNLPSKFSAISGERSARIKAILIVELDQGPNQQAPDQWYVTVPLVALLNNMS